MTVDEWFELFPWRVVCASCGVERLLGQVMSITVRFKNFWHESRTTRRVGVATSPRLRGSSVRTISEPAGEHMIKAMIIGGIIGYTLVLLAYGLPPM
jgi:hypothetical protein